MLLRFIANATCLDVARYVLPRMLTECDKLMLFEAQKRIHTYTKRHVEECARDGYIELFKYLLIYTRIHKRAAKLAARHGHIEIVKLISNYGEAMTYAAAKGGHVDVMRHLLTFKFNIHHNTLCRCSVRSGNIELIKLLSQKFQYNISDARWALENGDIAMWDWFIAHTPPWIRRATEHVRTIAHYDRVIMQGAEKTLEAFTNAARFGNLDLCKHMIACNNPYHADAFEAAGAHVHVMEWLKSIGCMSNRDYSRPHAAAAAGNIAASHWLISHQYDIGSYAWHEAAADNHVHYMKFLQELDIPPGQFTGMYALVCRDTSTITLEWLADECNVPFKIDWIVRIDNKKTQSNRAKRKWLIDRCGSHVLTPYNPLYSIILRSDREMIYYILAHVPIDIPHMLQWCARLTVQHPEKREKYDSIERALRSYSPSCHTK